ncbi:phage protease [Jeongeupia chitinilytica]|nr:phage protease [Jeongeupia chitinilytica]
MAHPAPLIAALTVEISQGQKAIKLLPAGDFRARDGRPVDCAAWHLDEVLAVALIAEANQRETRYVIDYEHQTLRSVENGKPAPAAGWFRTLEWRQDGLYATDVDWTATAAAMIEAREYLYLSPVFSYDKQGRVTGLLHVALTNNPALDELPELQVAALSRLVALSLSPHHEDHAMEDLLQQLIWLLNLPVGATADDIETQLKKLIDQVSGGKGMTAANVDLLQLLAGKDGQIAALSASQYSPATHVPLAAYTELQGRVVALTAQNSAGELDKLVVAALSDGRLMPSMESWARDLGTSNLAALSDYLAKAPKIAALTTTQTQGQPPAATAPAALAGDALAICAAFGNDPAAIAAAMKE